MTFKGRTIIILALLAPSIPVMGIYAYGYFSGQPVWQPIGLTRELVARTNPTGSDATIRIEFNWGAERTSDRDKFLAKLDKAVSARTDNFYFDVNDVPGNLADITFHVGVSSFGPYPPHRVADGLQLALTARQILLSNAE